jgi:hypothetical protein
VEGFTSPRSWAFSLVGIHAYLRHYHGDSDLRRLRELLSERLLGAFRENATAEWPWPEDRLTYANGKLPHALLLSGASMDRSDMIEAGLRSLDWLLGVNTETDGSFAPVGNKGWYRKDRSRAHFDQQPIEAHALVEACVEAHLFTRDQRWMAEARRCFDWFLGKNSLKKPLYDYETGGCRDGLHASGVNENQGAESTLAWLLSLTTFHGLKGREADSWAVSPLVVGRIAEALGAEIAQTLPGEGASGETQGECAGRRPSSK